MVIFLLEDFSSKTQFFRHNETKKKNLGKPSIDILCFTANFSEVRFSPPATMLYQHTEGSGPPYENLGTVRHKMRQKNLDTLFGF